MPPGRKSKYDTIDFSKVQLLAEKGFTEEEIADFYGICTSSLDNYKKEHPEFLGAIKAGKHISDTKVERSLFERACGYEHPSEEIFCKDGVVTRVDTTKKYPPDSTAAIFWLKNRKTAEWRDKQEVEHSGKLEGITITVVKNYPKENGN